MPEESASTRVLIASDRPLFRCALAESLESRGIEIAGQTGTSPKPDVRALGMYELR